MLGIEISTEDMAKELDRLMFEYTYEDGIFTVTIPNRRLDIDPYVNDIAEEIGRLYGYENLISTLPKVHTKKVNILAMLNIERLFQKDYVV